MEKDKIGAILKKRIAEQKYTQEQFAEISGIGISSLKKYCNGENFYNVELLERFADKLNCSYDYLLGYSRTPRREDHEIAEELRLSDEAIDTIRKHAVAYDNEFNRRKYIEAINTIICTDSLVECIAEFFLADRHVNSLFNSLMNTVFDSTISSNENLNNMYEKEDINFNLSTLYIGIIVYLLGDAKKNYFAKEEFRKMVSDYEANNCNNK